MKLLIADQDAQYAAMLLRAIRQSEFKDQLTASVRTEWETMSAEQLEGYDVLLIDSGLLPSMQDIPAAALTLLLSEQCGEADAGRQDVHRHVHKYQPVNRLLSEVLHAYEQHAGRGGRHDRSAGESCRIVGVYSASGGIGKTAIAVGLSQLLAAAGKRVFYLNMESIPSRLDSQIREEPKFCRILYQLKKGDIDSIRLLWFRDAERGFDTFPIPEHEAEWAEFGGEDIRSLIERVRTVGKYDCLVLDMESSLSERAVYAIEACSDLLWLTKDDADGTFKSGFAEKALNARLPDHLARVRRTVAIAASEHAPGVSSSLPYLKLLGMEVKADDD